MGWFSKFSLSDDEFVDRIRDSDRRRRRVGACFLVFGFLLIVGVTLLARQSGAAIREFGHLKMTVS